MREGGRVRMWRERVGGMGKRKREEERVEESDWEEIDLLVVK